ncbi:MAG TPA: flagellar basal body rod protein FlgC [Phycisphaerales bacterium]|nr:flagellar basal body rod protein FlgC [Phycisphaerales bacterium]
MFGLLDISTSGMIAQRTRLTAISANLANRNSTMPDGTPYRAKRVFFTPGNPNAATSDGQRLGVHVSTIEDDRSPFNLRWDPDHPRAIKSGQQAGYVLESNVNSVTEQMNAMQATRAYEANAAAAEATRSMVNQALRMLA